jgi:hypothetical protein
VTPTRLLAALIQPMLALLLLAGVPVIEPDRVGSSPRVHAVERVFALAKASGEEAGEWRQDAGAAAERLDGDDTPDAVSAVFASAPLDRASLIRIGRSFYATAPPSHRPCAALPTGPPLV